MPIFLREKFVLDIESWRCGSLLWPTSVATGRIDCPLQTPRTAAHLHLHHVNDNYTPHLITRFDIFLCQAQPSVEPPL